VNSMVKHSFARTLHLVDRSISKSFSDALKQIPLQLISIQLGE
jgi:hypothetical protein